MTSSSVDEHFTAAATTVDWKDCLRILTYAPTVQHFKLKLFKNIKTNIEITYFISTHLCVQKFMLIQKNLFIFALRQYLL